MSTLLRNTRVGGRTTSVLLDGARIDAIADGLHGERELDLQGAELHPGFVDTHTHLGWAGAALCTVDWSRGIVLAEVRRARSRIEVGHWLLGGGWEGGADLPSLARLDDAADGAPLFLVSEDASVALVNSRAAELMLLGTTDGRLEGTEARSRQTAGVVPPRDRQRERMELEVAVAELPRYGIVEVHDIATYPGEPDPPEINWERSYTDATLFDEVELPVRVRVRPSLHRRHEFLTDSRIHGLKLFAGPSYRWPGFETAREWVMESHAAGIPVSVHALRADHVSEAISLFEGLEGVPHRLVHVYDVHQEEIERIGGLGLTVEAQPWDTVEEMGTGPWRSLLDADVAVEFGSDWRDANLDALDPLVGIGLAVENGLTPEEAYSCYTRGSIAVGCPANLVAVADGQVILTIRSGRTTYSALGGA